GYHFPAHIGNECVKAKCKLKGINITECVISDSCECGVIDDITYDITGPKKDEDFLCTDQTPEVTFHNTASGFFFSTSFSFGNSAQTSTLCKTVPLAEDDIDLAERKEWMNTLKNLSQCKDITCTGQNIKFKLCILDKNNRKISQECFDKNVVPSVSVNNEAHLLYIDENIYCENCLLQVNFVEAFDIKSQGCFPIRIMPAKNKIKVKERSADKQELNHLTTSQGTTMEVLKKSSHGAILDSSVSRKIIPDMKPNIEKESFSSNLGSTTTNTYSPLISTSKIIDKMFNSSTSNSGSRMDSGILQKYKNNEFQADEPANPIDLSHFSSKIPVNSTLKTLSSNEDLAISLDIQKGLLENSTNNNEINFKDSIGSVNQTETTTTVQDAKKGQEQTTQTTTSSPVFSTSPVSLLRPISYTSQKILTNHPENTISVLKKKTTLDHNFSAKLRPMAVSITVPDIRSASQQDKAITKPNKDVSLNITRKTVVGPEANFKFNGLNEDLQRNNQFRPMALTRHEKTEQLLSITDPVQKAPPVRNTTLSFEDMWNKRMQALEEESPNNNFQAKEDDPPPREDPYIKIPEHEETFESTDLMAPKFKNVLSKKAYRGDVEGVQLLLSYGVEVDPIESKGQTPLLLASKQGHLSTIELLLSNGAHINHRNGHGETALMLSSKSGRLETVNLLVKRNADLHLDQKDGCTALMLASGKGFRDIVETLVQHGSSVNHQNHRGTTALSLAASGNHIDVVKLLLDFKADAGLSDEKGHNPLVHAARKGHASILELLLKHDTETGNAVKIASSCGYTQCVKTLCERNADVNKVDKNGITPLMLASLHNNSAIAEILLSHNADVSAVDKKGWSALMFASQAGCSNIAEMLMNIGANADQRSASGWSPLAIACLNGHIETVKVLLKYKADVNSIDADGWTPLMVAAQIKKLSIITIMKSLIESGAKVNYKNDLGWTALQVAVLHNCTDNVKFLLHHKADVDSFNNLGVNSVFIAIIKNIKDIIPLLLKDFKSLLIPNKWGFTPLMMASRTINSDLSEDTSLNIPGCSENNEMERKISLIISRVSEDGLITKCSELNSIKNSLRHELREILTTSERCLKSHIDQYFNELKESLLSQKRYGEINISKLDVLQINQTENMTLNIENASVVLTDKSKMVIKCKTEKDSKSSTSDEEEMQDDLSST
ncbi:hypothetical protein Btru_074133, partial [Bulinus truncatus]